MLVLILYDQEKDHLVLKTIHRMDRIAQQITDQSRDLTVTDIQPLHILIDLCAYKHIQFNILLTALYNLCPQQKIHQVNTCRIKEFCAHFRSSQFLSVIMTHRFQLFSHFLILRCIHA